MNGGCQASAGGARFYHETLDFVDCIARSLGSAGFDSLARPGSMVAGLVVAMSTIAVAMVGYRLLFGERVSVRDVVGLVARIGFALAMTTSWNAYHVVFYDVALLAPGQLGSQIAGVAQASDDELADRLQQIDDAFAAMVLPRDPARGVTEAPVDIPSGSPLSPAPPGTGRVGAAPAADISPVADATERARLILMVTSLGAIGATRLLVGLLLAIGPLFTATLVLVGSRGLFVGWLRVLGGAALGSFGVVMLLWIETAMLAPIVRSRLDDAAHAPLRSGDMVSLTAILLIMAIVISAAVVATARIMAAVRWPMAAGWRGPDRGSDRADIAGPSVPPPAGMPGVPAAAGDRTRTSNTVSSMERLASRDRDDGSRALGGSARTSSAARQDIVRVGGAGGETRRQIRSRISASGGRRDLS